MMIRVIAIVALAAAAVRVAPVEAQQVSDPGAQAGVIENSALHPRLTMSTSMGDIVLALDAEKAPYSTNNFVQYANNGYFAETIFHRVMKDFMIQGGGLTPGMDEKPAGTLPAIPNEWRNGLKNVRGSIAMARMGGRPHSATSQFFINVVDNGNLDQPQKDGAAYAVFGRVTEGMDVVDKIRDVEVGPHEKYDDGRSSTVPQEQVLIQSVTRTDGGSLTDLATTLQAHVEAVQQKQIEDIVAAAQQVGGHSLQRSASGLMWIVEKPGEGESPKPTDRVRVHYTGRLLDGTVFDSSVDRGGPEEFALNGVFKGWTEGVGLMKVGGVHTLIIPADLAFGAKGRTGVPANAVLHFNVELMAINP